MGSRDELSVSQCIAILLVRAFWYLRVRKVLPFVFGSQNGSCTQSESSKRAVVKFWA